MVALIGLLMIALSLVDLHRFGGELAPWNMPMWRIEMNAFNLVSGAVLVHLGIFARM